MSPTHSVSVAAVVRNTAGEVLLIQRNDNKQWQIPGGVLELEETPQAGAAREVLEETGVHVDIGMLTGVYKNTARGVVALVFSGRALDDSRQTSAETDAVEWFSPEAAVEIVDETFRLRILDALDVEAAGPAVRTHDGQSFQ